MKTVKIRKSPYITIKRILDVIVFALALVILSPVFLIVTILVRVKLESPVSTYVPEVAYAA